MATLPKINFFAAIYLVSLMSFPRSFMALKLALIIIYLGNQFLFLIRGVKRICIRPSLFLFYLSIMLVGVVCIPFPTTHDISV